MSLMTDAHMSDLQQAIRSGHYARQQIHGRNRLIAWSHRQRFATALRLAREFAGTRVLDYGCGDGTFLGLLAGTDGRPAASVGAEIHPHLVDDCRHRFRGQPGLRFVQTADLQGSDHDDSFDTVFCMEVLEHVVDSTPVLNDFERLLAPCGTLIVSVPIETGFPLIVKQIVRGVAGWRGVGDYPGTTGYTVPELVKSVLAGSAQHVHRPIFVRDDQTVFHDHKGFNWRTLRARIAVQFDLVCEQTSPLSWLGPQLGTQRWFVARRKP